MRAMIITALAALLFVACEQPLQQYTESSPEIDVAKNLIAAYEEGNFEAFPDAYADTAKIYQNSTEPMTIQEVIEEWKQQLPAMSEYGFEDDISYEMVITDDGEKWVGWWGVWNATHKATGLSFEIPVHVSVQFVDGKIVEEWGYWDNQPVAAAMAAAEAQQAAEEEAAEEETPEE